MKVKRITALFSTLMVLFVMASTLALPASAASTLYCSVSTTPAISSDPTRLPEHNTNLIVGESTYLNLASPTIKIKRVILEAKPQGAGDERYTVVADETAENYWHYAYVKFSIGSEGAVTMRATIYAVGETFSGSFDVYVHAKASDPSGNSTFDPVWPAQNANYISAYLYYWNSARPTEHATRSNYQNAIDIAGSGNVIAIESGKVIKAGWDYSGFGYTVIVRHNNGLYSLYGHLANISVQPGDTIRRATKIGVMGSTGNSTGTHLHLEVYDPKNVNRIVNPWVSFFQGRVSVTVGGNSRKASAAFSASDAAAAAWVNYLDTFGVTKNDGDILLMQG